MVACEGEYAGGVVHKCTHFAQHTMSQQSIAMRTLGRHRSRHGADDDDEPFIDEQVCGVVVVLRC